MVKYPALMRVVPHQWLPTFPNIGTYQLILSSDYVCFVFWRLILFCLERCHICWYQKQITSVIYSSSFNRVCFNWPQHASFWHLINSNSHCHSLAHFMLDENSSSLNLIFTWWLFLLFLFNVLFSTVSPQYHWYCIHFFYLLQIWFC